MYRFALLICAFVLCINCTQSAPSSSSALSALVAKYAAESAAGPAVESIVRPKQETGLTTYDQKQSGKYNIHLNIKDVAIIALDAGRLDSGVGDFGEDYYEDYDLSDFTVKPIFGLIDIASDKPSSTSTASPPPPLIHFEPDNETNQTANASNSTVIEEPILKDPVNKNKTQSVVIISGSTTPAPSISNDHAGANYSDILDELIKPATEDQPPKLSLADLANVHSASPLPFPIKPNEIPVQVILEQFLKPDLKQSSRHRPNGQWRLRNRIPATPSSNRRITPPHDEIVANPAIGTGF